MNLSLTQVGNFTALIPLIVILLGAFDIKVTESQVAEIVTGLVAFIGVATSIYGRYRQGDVTLIGVKKSHSDLR